MRGALSEDRRDAQEPRRAIVDGPDPVHLLEGALEAVFDPIVLISPAGRLVPLNGAAKALFTKPREGEPTYAGYARAVRLNRARLRRIRSRTGEPPCSRKDSQEPGETDLNAPIAAFIDPTSGDSVNLEIVQTKLPLGSLGYTVIVLHDRTEVDQKNRLYEELKFTRDLLEAKVRDATAELVRQNEVLRRQTVALETASSSKSLFVANMSHEFRTPLNAILGYTSMLLQGVSGELSAPIEAKLRRVDSNARQLLSIINNILDIARIEAGRMPVHPTRFAVAGLVDEVLAEMEPLLQKSRLKIRTVVAPGLPSLRSDRAKVKQILMNFVSNALKFTPTGSVTIRASADVRRNELRLRVIDTGIGIAPNDREAVFQDFLQVDGSMTRAYGGTGLGLAICRRLAAVLGGDIGVTSTLGSGSTFSAVLPLKAGRRRRS